ncbi:hypothetical protein L208DRAFT_1380385 [Tricholoma matsutake]|nr:hypothetical protein L208DRAFT_1380385 [Tricholoma matsutake 945]
MKKWNFSPGHDNTILGQLKQTQTNLAMLADIIVHGAGSGAPPVHAALALLLPKIQLPFWTPPPDVEHGHGHGHSYTPPPAGPADLTPNATQLEHRVETSLGDLLLEKLITLKYWPELYCYGKTGQLGWTLSSAGASSLRKGFWEKFTVDGHVLSYTVAEGREDGC